jgi:GAF domain-containing protein
MQMNPLLQDLIEQYYGSLDALPPDQASFLQTVNNLFISVTMDSGADQITQKTTEEAVIPEEKSELYVDLLQEATGQFLAANNAYEIFEKLTNFLTGKFNFACTRIFEYKQAAGGLELSAIKVKEGTSKDRLPPDTDTIRKAAETKKSAVEKNLQGVPQSLTQDAFTDISIPLVAWNELVGVLNIQTQKPIDPDLRLFLELLTAQTALIAKGIGLKDTVQEQVTELQGMQEIAAEASWRSFRDVASLKHQQYVYDQNLRTAVPQDNEANIDTEGLPVKPIEVQGELIGAFGINTGLDEPLTAEERALLESISQEVSQALERAHLFETSQRSAAELAVLNEMGNLFSGALDERTIVDGIYTYTSKLIETPQFYVAFYEDETDTIYFPKVVLDGELVTDEHPAAENFKPRPAGTGLTGHIIENRTPVLIQENAEQVLKEIGLPFQRFGGQTQSWLGVPMTMGDQVLGVITVQCDTEAGLYNQHHLDLLSTIASQAAVALNNIRLFQLEQERAEQERLVRTITDKVRRGTSTKAIMQIAIEELSEVLGADVSSIQLGTADQLIESSQTGPLKEAPQQPNGNRTNNEEEA